MRLRTLPKKVIPLAELSILEVVLALRIPSLLDFLNINELKEANAFASDLALRTLKARRERAYKITEQHNAERAQGFVLRSCTVAPR